MRKKVKGKVLEKFRHLKIKDKIRVIIGAGGEGTRARPITYFFPKPMIPIANKPLIHYTLDSLAHFGIFDEVVISVSYKKDKIIKSIGAKYKGLKIRYIYSNTVKSRDNDYADREYHIRYVLGFLKKYCKDNPRYVLALAGDVLYLPEHIKAILSRVNQDFLVSGTFSRRLNWWLDAGLLSFDYYKSITGLPYDEQFRFMKEFHSNGFSRHKRRSIKRISQYDVLSKLGIQNIDETYKRKSAYLDNTFHGNVIHITNPKDCLKANLMMLKKYNSIEKSFFKKPKIVSSELLSAAIAKGSKTISSKLKNTVVYENSEVINSDLENCICLPDSKVYNQKLSNKIIMGNEIFLLS